MKHVKTLAVTTLAIGALAFTGCSGTKTGTNLGRAIDGTMYNEGSWYNNDNNDSKYGDGTIGSDGVWYNNAMYDNYHSGTVMDGYGTGYYGSDDYYSGLGLTDYDGYTTKSTYNDGYYYNSYGQRFYYGDDGVLRNDVSNTANGYNYNLGFKNDMVTSGNSYSGLYNNSLVEAR